MNPLGTFADTRLPLLHAGDASFTNVAVTLVTPTDLYFSHAAGMSNVKLKDLDAALQKRFGYNATHASTVARAQAEANRSYYMMKAAEKPPVVLPEPEVDVVVEPSPAKPAAGTSSNGISLTNLKAKQLLGSQAPQVTVEKWLTPTPATPGKLMLVEFWATWSDSSRAVIPKLNAFQDKFGDRLVIVGLTDESESAVKLMKSPVINYSSAIDTKARMKRAVQVAAVPHTILIDPQGIIRFEGNPQELTEAMLQELLSTYAQ